MDRREDVGTSCSNSNSNNNNNNNKNNVISKNRNNRNKNKKAMTEMQWTNEKHSDFLRLMEASFVRNLVMERSSNEDSSSSTTTNKINSRLDRFVPDISESTLDLHPRSAHSTDRVNRTCNRQKERGIIRPYKITHDQVVPRAEDKVGNNKKTTN